MISVHCNYDFYTVYCNYDLICCDCKKKFHNFKLFSCNSEKMFPVCIPLLNATCFCDSSGYRKWSVYASSFPLSRNLFGTWQFGQQSSIRHDHPSHNSVKHSIHLAFNCLISCCLLILSLLRDITAVLSSIWAECPHNRVFVSSECPQNVSIPWVCTVTECPQSVLTVYMYIISVLSECPRYVYVLRFPSMCPHSILSIFMSSDCPQSVPGVS